MQFLVNSILSERVYLHTQSYGWYRSKPFFIFILASLTLIALQGCERKESPLMIYEKKCQNAVSVVGQAINKIKQTASARLIKEKVHSSDSSVFNITGGDIRLTNESQLWELNSVLISIDNKLNASRLAGALYTDDEFKKAIAQCELSILDKKQNLLSDTGIYSHISQLDLSESLVTTQHFYNKLLALFRNYGATKESGDRQTILQYQKTLAELEVNQRQRDSSEPIISYLTLSEKKYQAEEQLSSIQGYPKQSMKFLDQTMALDEDTVFDFINRMEGQLKPLRIKNHSEDSQNRLLNYSQFRDGVFEAIAILFKMEFLPANKTITKEGKEDKKMLSASPSYTPEMGMPERYNVLKDGKIMGHLELNVLDSLHGNIKNQFYPIKKGIKGSQIKNNQLPEGAIILVLDNENKTNTKERFISISAANDLVFLIGKYLAHLSSGEQEWVLNSGIAVENDFNDVPGYVLQQWLYRPKLLKVVLANNKSVTAEEYLSQIKKEDFLAIKKQLITAKLRIAYVNISSDLSLVEKEEKIKNTLQSILTKYALYFSKNEEDNIIESMLACDSFCYESVWAKMIAMDVMTTIDQWDELDEVMINRFMEKIMIPGASRTAEDGVSDFLGRYYNENAFSTYFSE